MKVGVVYGGTPEESPASILNARDAARALESRGYTVELIEFEKDIISVLKQKGCDVVFLCVQGKGYGDGTFQAMLEETLERLSASGAEIYQTRQSGAITMRHWGGAWHIQTFLEASNEVE